MPRYTRTDLTITYGASNFGGPVATAVVSGGPLAERTFELKSTEGLSQLDGVLDKPQVAIESVPALGVDISGWMPAAAEQRYLARLDELRGRPV